MKIRMTFDYDDYARTVLGHHYGQQTMTRDDLIQWIRSTLDATFDELQWDYHRQLEGRET